MNGEPHPSWQPAPDRSKPAAFMVEQIPDGEAFFARQHGGNAVALDVFHRGAETGRRFRPRRREGHVLAGEIAPYFRLLRSARPQTRPRGSPSGSRLCVLSATTLVGFRVDSLINKAVSDWEVHSGFRIGRTSSPLQSSLAVTNRTTP